MIFIYFQLCWVFVAARGLSLVAVSLGYALGAVLRLLIAVASLVAECRLQGAWASVVAADGLSSCGAQPKLPRGVWGLPGPGIEPKSPALANEFLTTGPPAKSYRWYLNPRVWMPSGGEE